MIVIVSSVINIVCLAPCTIQFVLCTLQTSDFFCTAASFLLQGESESQQGEWAEEEKGAAEGLQDGAPALGPQDIEGQLHVKDAGMMIVSTIVPDFTWQSGNADIAVK